MGISCLYHNKGEILKVNVLKDGLITSNSCCDLMYSSINSYLKPFYLYKNNRHEMFSSQEQCCFMKMKGPFIQEN